MEGRIAHTLDTLREALDAAYAVRNGALERGDLDFVAREEAQISRLEERITQLEGTATARGTHGRRRRPGGAGYQAFSSSAPVARRRMREKPTLIT